MVTREVLEEVGLEAWPKTSGSRGIHVYARITPAWGSTGAARGAGGGARGRGACAEARDEQVVEEERHGVFLDYNQNAKDRTVASAYSVRPTPDARVSMPVTWAQLAECDPGEFTLKTVPELFAKNGDAHAKIDDAPARSRSSSTSRRVTSATAKATRRGSALRKERERAAARRPIAREEEAGLGRRRRARGDGGKPARPKAPLIHHREGGAEEDALEGLERWKERHPKAADASHPGRRPGRRDARAASPRVPHPLNLRHVPDDERPPPEPPDPDYEPTWGPQ